MKKWPLWPRASLACRNIGAWAEESVAGAVKEPTPRAPGLRPVARPLMRRRLTRKYL